MKNLTCVWRNIYNTARATHSRYYKHLAKHACDFSLILLEPCNFLCKSLITERFPPNIQSNPAILHSVPLSRVGIIHISNLNPGTVEKKLTRSMSMLLIISLNNVNFVVSFSLRSYVECL